MVRGLALMLISIHAPLAGCDALYSYLDGAACISIHAPLAGCDLSTTIRKTSLSHFNPRTPCGVRHIAQVVSINTITFQSTHPLRGATVQVYDL